jgi:hypothetical protein
MHEAEGIGNAGTSHRLVPTSRLRAAIKARSLLLFGTPDMVVGLASLSEGRLRGVTSLSPTGSSVYCMM